MDNLYQLLTTLYVKDKLAISEDIGTNLVLNKILSKNPENLHILKKIVHYSFFLDPKSYFYLLYLCIPKKSYVPKSIKLEPKKVLDNSEFYDIIKKSLQIGNNDIKYNKSIINHIINQDKKYWKAELGVK